MSTPTGPGPQGQQGQDQQSGRELESGPTPEPGSAPEPGSTAAPGGAPAPGSTAAPGGAPAPGSTAAPGGAPAQASGTSTLDVVRIVVHVLALILVVLGISLDLDNRGGGMWSDSWAWSGFATLMALAQLAALLPRSAGSGWGWLIGAVGAGGLLLFWTLLMLPMISTNAAFLVTLGTACAVAGVLLSPDRRV